MRTVRLSGELGRKFGAVHSFNIKNPAEAIRALAANHRGFEKHLIESDSRGVGYKVMVDEAPLEASELGFPMRKNCEIVFVPVIRGSGGDGGSLQIIAGAVLIMVGAALTVTGYGSPFGGALVAAGVGMTLGGFVQVLSKLPLSDGPQERPENSPSYYFNGAVNTIAQGHPVPVGYGRLIVGSAVISAGISVEEIPVDS